jgi:hypothetical protein
MVTEMNNENASPEACPVCGAQDPKSCREIENLGVRSLDANRENICPVCGGDYAMIVWTGVYKMCELCSRNKEQAVRILKHKHRKKLNRILAELDRE